jgi:hypothetical protein
MEATGGTETGGSVSVAGFLMFSKYENVTAEGAVGGSTYSANVVIETSEFSHIIGGTVNGDSAATIYIGGGYSDAIANSSKFLWWDWSRMISSYCFHMRCKS